MFTAQLALKAKDGYAVLAGSAPDKWAGLWRHIGREDLLQDTRFLGQGVTGEFYFNNVVPAIEEWSQHQAKLDIAQQLITLGFSMGVVQNTADIDQCPHLAARKMFVEIGDTVGGAFRAVNTPIRLTECPDTPNGTPPSLGEHNQEILCGIGGLTAEELEQMEADGVV
jgi:formyl-CoA transferase